MTTALITTLPEKNTQQDSDFFNIQSPEMYINMDPSRLPAYDHPDFIAFGLEEKRKCQEGLNINGTIIPGNLYYDLNFHTLALDVEDRMKKVLRAPSRPQLRDNGWIIHTDYARAQQAKQAYIVAGSRQIGKSDTLVSLSCRELFCYQGAEVMGLFSAKSDKETYTKKLEIALNDGVDLRENTQKYVEKIYWPENHPNFLIVPNIDKDFAKEKMRFGMTKPDNTVVNISTLFTYLTQGGQKTQIGAGKSLTFFFYDEIAKAPMKGPWEAVKPAILSEFGYRCAAFMAFTGGEVEQGQDAMGMFLNPLPNKVLPFRTENRDTGRFIGGWYRSDFKEKTTLARYLGLPDEGPLAQMEIKATNFEKATRILAEEEALATTDNNPETLRNLKTFYPTTLADMATSKVESPFKNYIELLRKHKLLLDDTRPGAAYKVFRLKGESIVRTELIDKRPLTNFPHQKGDDVDGAPIMIYDMPRYDYSYKLHVGGLDPYHTGITETSPSLGAFYLMRRHYGSLDDAFQDAMVLSWAARPEKTGDFIQTIHDILDLYGATMLHENSNDLVLNHFDKENVAELYLAKAWSLQKEINPNSKAQNVYGLTPTPANQRAWMNRILEYIKEPIGLDQETGKVILGYTRILDPMLLQEMIDYKDGGNFDRLVAFGHALLYMSNLDKFSEPDTKQPKNPEPQESYRKQPYGFKEEKKSSDSSPKKRDPFGL